MKYRPGEVLLIPSGWHHATYNPTPAIGVACQVHPVLLVLFKNISDKTCNLEGDF